MSALFKFFISTRRMFVEPCLLALFEAWDVLVLYSECLVARRTHDGRVDYCDSFRQLELVAKLVVHIHR